MRTDGRTSQTVAFFAILRTSLTNQHQGQYDMSISNTRLHIPHANKKTGRQPASAVTVMLRKAIKHWKYKYNTPHEEESKANTRNTTQYVHIKLVTTAQYRRSLTNLSNTISFNSSSFHSKCIMQRDALSTLPFNSALGRRVG